MWRKSPWKEKYPEKWCPVENSPGKRSREKGLLEKKSPWKKVPGQLVSERAFSVKGMTGKCTEESKTIFKNFYRLIPSDDHTHTKRHSTLTDPTYTKLRKMGVREPFFQRPFFRGFFFLWNIYSGSFFQRISCPGIFVPGDRPLRKKIIKNYSENYYLTWALPYSDLLLPLRRKNVSCGLSR